MRIADEVAAQSVPVPPLPPVSDLQNEEEQEDDPHPRVGAEEENEVAALGVHEAGRQIGELQEQIRLRVNGTAKSLPFLCSPCS